MVTKAYLEGFKVSSNFSREYAIYVAQAASLNLITTMRPDGYFDNTWRVTMHGLHFMKENLDV